MYGLSEAASGKWCSSWHVPPRYLGNPEDYYSGSPVFCVVRHPYERIVSEYKYQLAIDYGRYKTTVYDKEPCTEEGINHFVQTTLQKVLSGDPFLNDCHMIPQNEYVWGVDRQWCTEVLHIENLADAFNNLMATHGYTVHMDDINMHMKSTVCPLLSRGNLTNETKRLVNLVYLEDFRLLQYKAS